MRAGHPQTTLCPCQPFCAPLGPSFPKNLWRGRKNGGIIAQNGYGRIQPPARREGEGIWKPKPVPSGPLTPSGRHQRSPRLRAPAAPGKFFSFSGIPPTPPMGKVPGPGPGPDPLRRGQAAGARGQRIVVACNTATSAAIGLLRQLHLGLPIIGIEPAVKPAAALAAGSSSVIVMATPSPSGRINTKSWPPLSAATPTSSPLPCKGLAEMVERGIFDGPVLDAYLQDLLTAFPVLQHRLYCFGLYHYPFVRKAIARNFGRPVSIIDAVRAPPGSFAASWRPRLF